MKIRTIIADFITGGAFTAAKNGRQANWDHAQENWRLAEQRLSEMHRLESHLRRAEDESRAMSKAHREQMDQIKAELSELIDARPMSEQAKQLRAIRALTK